MAIVKKNIGIDIDDCVTQTAQLFCSFSRELLKKNLSVRMLTGEEVKFEDLKLVTSEEAGKIKNYYSQRRVFRTIKGYPYAVPVLKTLAHKYHLFFITSRDDYAPGILQNDTDYWFRKRGINEFTLVFSKKKGEVARKYHLDIFVEDSIKYARSILQTNNSIKMILLNRPWNKEFRKDKDIIFTDSWRTLKKLI